ncbi:MAG: hypothetical protein ACYC0Q_06470 [Eubacteriales bacterium]
MKKNLLVLGLLVVAIVWYHTWHGNYVSMESADDASHTEGHSN